MIIIGEKINSTIKDVGLAIENKNEIFIQGLAKRQEEAGAAYIDLNAGMFVEDEPEKLEWLVKTVQQTVVVPLSIDSPNPVAVERALKANKNGKPLINSITNEKERFDAVLPLILEYNTSVVALCMDDNEMPETVDDRFRIAQNLIEKLTKKGMKLEDIFIDPMVRPIGTGSHYGIVAIDTIRKVKAEYPGVNITCGLSNISYGIPARKAMNQAFLIAAMTAGMDGAILNPLDKKLMTLVYATEALLGKDEYCMNYLTKFREGLLEI
jgi:cobalamin-dependent methionine synthase I